MFDAAFFRGNREKLRTLFTGTAPIVLTANGLLQRSTDSAYPFKQDGNFWYLTGIKDPNILLVMDKGKEYLIVPTLSETRVAFDGALNSDELVKISGIEEILPEKEGWKRLGVRLKKASSVAVLSPSASYIEQLGMYTNPARKKLIRDMKHVNPNLELLDLRQHLQVMRMVKQQQEIAAIQQAINATSTGILTVRKKFEKAGYTNEFEIEQELTSHFFKNGSNGHSFEPIVAGGRKGLTLHPVSNTHTLKKGEQLLLDVGAECEQYAADISRTWQLKPTKRFMAVHQAVQDVQDFAMEHLKPGVLLKTYEQQVHDFMGEKLRELGLINTIDRKNVRKYFPHASSHFLGIDVHDIGDYERPLEPGVVLTVEPGIYMPEEGIGVRIEDDVLITETGTQNLSADLPRSW